MNDDAWRRHAHPWSVYTRFATIPPLVLAVWSRAWIGWWCLVPVALLAGWLWLNVRVFPPVDRPTAWASKGIYGERIWATQADCGIVLLVWGLVALEVWPTVAGVTLVVLAQLWRIDRLVWMYDELLTCR